MRSTVWSLFLMLLPAVGSAGLPLQMRNDSGQGQCYDAAGTVQPCSLPGYRGEDGQHGRDAAAADGVLVKTGGGDGGFDFTKIANNGGALPASAVLGTAPASWACTRDNHTGLLWEIKISNAASPRHFEWAFHWYQPDPEHDGGNPGEPGGVELGCGFTLDCNTQAYIDYVNGQALCGRTDWRLPSLDEMHDLIDLDRSQNSGGALDPVYFADGGPYRGFGGAWTADTGHEPGVDFAFGATFSDGGINTFPKAGLFGIRVVSGTLVESEGEPPVCGGIENPQIRPGTAGAYELDGPTVLDRRTGLVWDRCSLGQKFVDGGEQSHCEGDTWKGTWQEALLEARARNAAGHLGFDDWRVPNIKELASLRERRCAMPVVDVRTFPDIDAELHWTSTTMHHAPTNAWGMNFEFGQVLMVTKDFDRPRLRLVRGGGGFDDYQSTVAYEIAGQLGGMVGTGVVLHLATSAGGSESLTVDADGRFAFVLGVLTGQSYTVTVASPPVPEQACQVVEGSGTVGSADVENVRVVCDQPAPPAIRVEPPDLNFHVQQSGTQTQNIGIANDGGGILSWSIDTAYEALPAAGRGAPADCQGGSGLIVHDDGSAESAYGGNFVWTAGVMIVDQFTPSSYPASIGTACFAFGTTGVGSLAFEIVVLDDNGPGGSPGTELGSMAVTATGIPSYPVADPVWQAFDLSALYTTIESGSVYVGLRWYVSNPQDVFVLADESADRPVGHAGGYYWNYGGAGDWRPIQNAFGEYRAMLIRAIEAGPQAPPAGGCESPSAVPWLTITPPAGTVNAGTESQVAIGINSAGLEPGDYHALLCVHSNDGNGNTPMRVNVHLMVEPGEGVLTIDPPAIAFGPVGIGATGVGTTTLRSTGTGTVQGIQIGAVAAPFARGGGTCPSGPFNLSAGTSCTLGYAFTPTAFGPVAATLTIDSSAGVFEVGLSGSGAAGAPAVVVALGGGGQSTAVGHPFALPLAVQVRDGANNPVSGASVVFTAPGSGAGAILAAASATTDDNGYASVGATANAVTGSYLVQASVSGVATAAAFALSNTLGSGDIAVSLQAGRDHVRPGQLIDYVLTVFNPSGAAATSVQVGSALDAALDAAATHWICLDALASGCTSAGQGALADSGLSLAPGASVSYLLTSPVRLDVAEQALVSSALVEAPNDPNPANDQAQATTAMVLFRDGLERYGDGASAGDAEHAADWPAAQQVAIELPPDTASWRVTAPLQVLAGDRPVARIERFQSGGADRVRLVVFGDGVEHAAAWLSVTGRVQLSVEHTEAGAALRLTSGEQSARLPLAAEQASWRLRHAAALGVSWLPPAELP